MPSFKDQTVIWKLQVELAVESALQSPLSFRRRQAPIYSMRSECATRLVQRSSQGSLVTSTAGFHVSSRPPAPEDVSDFSTPPSRRLLLTNSDYNANDFMFLSCFIFVLLINQIGYVLVEMVYFVAYIIVTVLFI